MENKSDEERTSLIPAAEAGEILSPGALGAMAQAEAEVRAACAMAVKYPRDWDVVREKLLKECRRPIFAAGREPGKGAIYSKPVGNGSVTGLSIRFAEAAIAVAGHIHVSTRTLSETDEQRKLSVKVWDAQGMNSFADEITVEKTMERKVIPKGSEILRTRLNRAGDLLYIIRADADALLNKENALKSKSIRNSALRLMPGWLLDESREALEATILAKDAEDPDAAKHQIMDAFSKLGVGVDEIKKFLGHDATVLTAGELLQLRGLYTAIRDGETTINQVFAQLEAEKQETTRAESIRQRLTERKKNMAPTNRLETPLQDDRSKPMAPPHMGPVTAAATEAHATPLSASDAVAASSSLATAAAAPASPEIILSATGTLLDTTHVGGKHFVVLKEGGKFRLDGPAVLQSARRRKGKQVIVHYQVIDGAETVLAIENAQ